MRVRYHLLVYNLLKASTKNVNCFIYIEYLYATQRAWSTEWGVPLWAVVAISAYRRPGIHQYKGFR